MKRVLEIRAAEGGEDSKLFVKDLAQAYLRLFERVGWKHRLLGEWPGELHIEVLGKDLTELIKEAGGHRIQRVPPTERKGRVHTSTVTVAVIDPSRPNLQINDNDLKVEWYSGTGAGGQHRNKHQNSCRLTHIPTGAVATAQCRSRLESESQAKVTIVRLLQMQHHNVQHLKEADLRKGQVGSGERGDKIRTYRFQDDTVKDHRTKRSASLSMVMRGCFDLLW